MCYRAIALTLVSFVFVNSAAPAQVVGDHVGLFQHNRPGTEVGSAFLLAITPPMAGDMCVIRALMPHKTELNGPLPHTLNHCLTGEVYQTELLRCYHKHLRDLTQHERSVSPGPRATSVRSS